jgi:pimeloyl-ACP methyl ester carboxylesterase
MNRSLLLLLPGVLCDETIWSNQTRPGALRVNTIVPDYRDATTLEAMALRTLDIAPPTFALAGHSMGARVAIEVIRIAPDRVERLALLNTGVHPVQPGEADKRMALVELGESEGVEALIDAWLSPMVHPRRRTDASLMEPLRVMCRRSGVELFRRQAEAMLARPDAAEVLQQIRCPTLVAAARQDEWSPLAQHQAIAATIPNSELILFEESGHMAPFEAPDQVNAALLHWIGR